MMTFKIFETAGLDQQQSKQKSSRKLELYLSLGQRPIILKVLLLFQRRFEL